MEGPSGNRNNELELPIGVDRQLHVVRRPDDAARPLGEHRRLLRNVEDPFLGVRPVVEADREDLWGSRYRCLQLTRVDVTRATGVVGRSPVDECLPIVEHQLRIGRKPAVARGGNVDDSTIDKRVETAGEIEEAHASRAYARTRYCSSVD